VIDIAPALLKQIADAAEAAYPHECCGLLAGQPSNAGLRVTRVIASTNVAASNHVDSFEVDPQVRFDLMRELGEIGDGPTGDERLIGHYHSHPDHPAEPSARDLEKAFEPDLVWIIAAVHKGVVGDITAHRLDAAENTFRTLPLRSTNDRNQQP